MLKRARSLREKFKRGPLGKSSTSVNSSSSSRGFPIGNEAGYNSKRSSVHSDTTHDSKGVDVNETNSSRQNGVITSTDCFNPVCITAPISIQEIRAQGS